MKNIRFITEHGKWFPAQNGKPYFKAARGVFEQNDLWTVEKQSEKRCVLTGKIRFDKFKGYFFAKDIEIGYKVKCFIDGYRMLIKYESVKM